MKKLDKKQEEKVEKPPVTSDGFVIVKNGFKRKNNLQKKLSKKKKHIPINFYGFEDKDLIDNSE